MARITLSPLHLNVDVVNCDLLSPDHFSSYSFEQCSKVYFLYDYTRDSLWTNGGSAQRGTFRLNSEDDTFCWINGNYSPQCINCKNTKKVTTHMHRVLAADNTLGYGPFLRIKLPATMWVALWIVPMRLLYLLYIYSTETLLRYKILSFHPECPFVTSQPADRKSSSANSGRIDGSLASRARTPPLPSTVPLVSRCHLWSNFISIFSILQGLASTLKACASPNAEECNPSSIDPTEKVSPLMLNLFLRANRGAMGAGEEHWILICDYVCQRKTKRARERQREYAFARRSIIEFDKGIRLLVWKHMVMNQPSNGLSLGEGLSKVCNCSHCTVCAP